MARKHRDWCQMEGCENPNDKERGDSLCTPHSTEWRNSEAFRAALKDDNIRGLMQLGLKDMAMRRVATFRRRWMKSLVDA
mgnify:CR=1 FL=1